MSEKEKDEQIEELTHDTSRVGAFSDGVFAIVITLLVLNLHVAGSEDKRNWQELLSALTDLWSKFFGFLLSFFFLSVFWISHHQFFFSLRTSNRKLLWLNNLFLLFIIFIPFPTGILGDYPNNKTAVIFFGAAMFAASSSFALLRWYAWSRSDTLSGQFEQDSLKHVLKRSLIVPALTLAAIAIALVSTKIAIAIYLIAPIAYIIPHTLRSRTKQDDDSSV